jgi:hypothetical protein
MRSVFAGLQAHGYEPTDPDDPFMRSAIDNPDAWWLFPLSRAALRLRYLAGLERGESRPALPTDVLKRVGTVAVLAEAYAFTACGSVAEARCAPRSLPSS